MASGDAEEHASPPVPNRLNGWKEIAAWFGKGVRTVQRWEKEAGLPVRRIRTGSGDVVYALVPELETWQESDAAAGALAPAADRVREPSKPAGAGAPDVAPRRPARPRSTPGIAVRVAAGAIVLAATLGSVAWIWLGRAAPPGEPASARIVGNALEALDADGQFLWKYAFDFDLDRSSYDEDRQRGRQLVQIADLDADGHDEVLYVSNPALPSSRGLFCFNSDGTLRFRRQPDPTVTYGASTPDELKCTPPWRGDFVRTTGAPGRPRDVWFVSDHLSYFPTILERFDANGNVLDEYWSNGRISSIGVATLGGRPLLFVGAINNETKGGSLAVLDARHPTATAPAGQPAYRCAGCPAAAPLAFLVFPRLDVAVAARSHSHVATVMVDRDGQILVDVAHGTDEAAASHYVLDRAFRVIRAEVGEFYARVHGVYQHKGLLDHPFSVERESRDLWPVLRWDGTRFQEILGPES